jgi:hypothetical protein
MMPRFVRNPPRPRQAPRKSPQQARLEAQQKALAAAHAKANGQEQRLGNMREVAKAKLRERFAAVQQAEERKDDVRGDPKAPESEEPKPPADPSG